jgi:hypothetical protein
LQQQNVMDLRHKNTKSPKIKVQQKTAGGRFLQAVSASLTGA